MGVYADFINAFACLSAILASRSQNRRRHILQHITIFSHITKVIVRIYFRSGDYNISYDSLGLRRR